MQPDSTTISTILNEVFKLFERVEVLVTIIVGILAIIPRFVRWWQTYQDRRSLRKRLGAELYTAEDILSATQYYIKPNCQDVDPTQEEEIRLVHAVQARLFKTVDKMLDHPTKYKYLIVLADSGMGKTSFVLNYYARHWRHWHRRRRFHLALVPLGIPNPDVHIKEIPDKTNTVLFLDAFDEDTQAIRDHRQRVAQLLELCRGFRQVLLTSRTQFFPREEEIPRETGILKTGVTPPRETHAYQFYKLYLSPFSDAEVTRYLRRRFSIWKWNQRRQARKIVQKIPLLTARPMILAHIQDLVQSGKSFAYAFQLYEEMVAAWLKRERPFVEDTNALRQFSENLAVDLYLKREQRGAERVPYSELEPLAGTFGIKLQVWQLRSRSFLNRDAAGNYKFAHRSIMEYLFVKRFLESEPDSRPKTDWTDQMSQFVLEIIRHKLETNQRLPDLSYIKLFSSQLRTHSKSMTEAEVKRMLTNLDLFDSSWNEEGKGIRHHYLKCRSGDGDNIVFDMATGLMWQQSGSSKIMTFEEAKEWIKDLNRKGYAGYHDWRLPTLEEAMSLMEPRKQKGALYIDHMFGKKQRWIWTCDLVQGESRAWVVHFTLGHCLRYYFLVSNYVRAVRSGQSSGG